MANISDETVALPPKFEVANTARAVNVFWFSSLMLAIFASLFGIFVKQWLHTYNNWTDVGNPREAVMLRSTYYNALFTWRISEILSVLPLLLQVALILFIVGLIAHLWTVDIVVAIVASVFGLVGGAVVVTVVLLPLWHEDCAYKSPLAFFLVQWWRRHTESKWRLYDLHRAKLGFPNSPEDNPWLHISHELTWLLGITPADGDESLLNNTVVSARVNELDSYADTLPFQLLQAIVAKLTRMAPLPYDNIPQSLLGIVEVFCALTQCKKYKFEPQVTVGIAQHVFSWNPTLTTNRSSVERCLKAIQMLSDALLNNLGVDDERRLHEAGFDMLVQSLHQWTAMKQTNTNMAQSTTPGLDQMQETSLRLQRNLDAKSKPLVQSHTSGILSVSWSADGAYIAVSLLNG